MGARVLLAVTPGTRQRLGTVLHGHQLTWVQTFDEVRAGLEQGRFDLVLIGAHFQESNAFDVLRLVTSMRPAPRIVCLRGAVPRSLLGKPSMDAFRIACEALGASLVLDLVDYPDDAAGNGAVRSLLEHELQLAA
jgi:hypothetical protein